MVLLFSVYIYAGFNKIFNFESTKKSLKTKLSFLPEWIIAFCIVSAIIIEIVCPLLILFFNGNKEVHNINLFILILFTFIVSIVYHNPLESSNISEFLKNMALIGGMCLLYTYSN